MGKAKSVRKRVASHFSKAQVPSSPGHAEMVASVESVEFVVVATEAEALLAEQSFIKQYRPRFNIRLRDDKSYLFIAISLDEDYPRVYFTRERHRPRRAYFGPYSNAKRVRGTLEVLAKVFMFRSCTGPEPGRRSGSPCLDYDIKRCEAPCVGYVSKQEYRASIDGVIDFLAGASRTIFQGVVVERFEPEQRAAREQRSGEREERVLGGRADEDEESFFDEREQHVLLRAGEAVHLVEEEDRALAALAEPGPGALGDLAHVLDARAHRAQASRTPSR